MKASDNAFPSVLVAETAAASVLSPLSGQQRLFVDTDHVLKLKDHDGNVVEFGGSSLDSDITDALAGAASPSSSNPFATMADVGEGGGGGGAPSLPIDAAAAAAVGDGDLFGGTSLDGDWSALQTTAITAADRSHANWLVLKSTGNTAGQDRGLKRPFAPAGDFEVRTKIHWATLAGQYQWVGLFVGATVPGDGSGGKRLELFLLDSGALKLKFATNGAAGEGSISNVSLENAELNAARDYGQAIHWPVWLRIKRVGSTLYAGISWDGIEYVDCATTTTIDFTVATCGLFIASNSPSTTDARAAFAWIATVG